MKKQLFAVLCTCALTATFIPSVFAADTDADNSGFEFTPITDENKAKRPDHRVEKHLLNVDSDNGSILYSEAVTDPSATIESIGTEEELQLIEYFRLATENFQEEIDVSQFEIGYDEATDKVDVAGGISYGEFYEMLVYCSPRSYYLISTDGTFEYFYPYVENGIIQYIYPIYSSLVDEKIYDDDYWIDMNKLKAVQSDISTNMLRFDSAIREIKSLVDEDDSDFEKLVKYHDYIVMNYSYDWDSFSRPFTERTNNTAFDLIRNRRGLCESMSILYNYLMMDMGLDTSFISSYDSNSQTAYHTWNMVRIAIPECGINEEEWFHLDVTWDENATEYTPDDGKTHLKRKGKTAFNNFLVSSDASWNVHGTVPHVYYTKDDLAKNAQLDGVIWRKVSSQLAVHKNMLYYLMNDNNKTELHRINAAGTNEILESFDANSQSGLVVQDDTLYYNTDSQICAYDITSKETIKTDISLSENQQLSGLYQAGDHIGYYTTDELEVMVSLDYNVSTPTISDGKVTIPISSGLNKPFFVTVKDGDTYKTVSIETNKDITIPVANESGIKTFIWNKAMKPYINSTDL